jgi:MFS family permease
MLPLILLLTSFATILAVLFTPAFPAIAQELAISPSTTQLTMTLYLVGYALGNLPYGPFANRYGRKPTLLFGIFIALIGSIAVSLVPWIPSLTLFLTGRFLMGFGASVGIKIATTIIGDIYNEHESRKITPYIILSFAIVPAIAMFIGGILTQHFGWTSCLYFLVGYSIFQFLLCLPMKETCKEFDLDALNWGKIGEKYLKKTKNKIVMLSALSLGLGTSFVYLFAAEAPFIAIQHLGLSPELFGSMNFIPSIGMVAGGILARLLADKYSSKQMLRVGVLIVGFGSCSMLLCFLFRVISVYTLFLPMPVIYFGLSFIFANALPLGITHAKDKSTASAVLNFFNIFVTVVVLAVLGSFASHSLAMMPLIFTCAAFLLFGLIRAL